MTQATVVALDRITYDTATQMRAGIDETVVDEYVENIKKLPPVELMTDSVTYWIVDGWHRVCAFRRAGLEGIPATVKPGTRDDAIDAALGANHGHGLRRTKADKRKVVRIALTTHPEMSDRSLARLCHVSPMMINTYRSLVEGADTDVRIGADGIEYKVKRAEDDESGDDGDGDGEFEGAGAGDEHYTPDELLDPIKALLGRIELDPSSCELANARVKARRIHTLEDDGLAVEWTGTGSLFVNPAYSLAQKFAHKFVDVMERPGGFQHGVLLVNNPTEAIWFQRAWRACSAVCLVLGRRSFIDGVTGIAEGTGRKGSVIFYFGDRVQKFARLFAPLGICCYPQPDGTTAYTMRTRHNGWCVQCGEPCSTGRHCPTCKQTDGRTDRAWRNPVRAAVAMAMAKGNEQPNPTALAVKIAGTPSWKRVAALMISDKLVAPDYAKELAARLRAASGGVENIEEW